MADGQQTHSPPSPAPDRGTASANAGPETTRPPSDDAQPSAADMTPGSNQPGRSAHDTTGHPGPGGQAEPRADTSGQPRPPTQDGSDLTPATTGQGHFAGTDAPSQHTEPREAPDQDATPSELPAGQDTDQPPQPARNRHPANWPRARAPQPARLTQPVTPDTKRPTLRAGKSRSPTIAQTASGSAVFPVSCLTHPTATHSERRKPARTSPAARKMRRPGPRG